MTTGVRRSQREGRLAIVAGRGKLPLHIASAARASGDNPFILTLNGEAGLFPAEFEQAELDLADGKRLLTLIKDKGIDRVILSGGINRRPDISELRIPLRLLKGAFEVGRALTGAGDDKLLRVIISMIETSGCRVIGAQEVVPNLLAEEGTISARKPDKSDRKDIEAACAGANALGSLDIGQGLSPSAGALSRLKARKALTACWIALPS